MYKIGAVFACFLAGQVGLASELAADGTLTGIWSIAAPRKEQRRVIIHSVDESKTSDAPRIYHIEVIKKAKGAPSWDIKRIAKHMAITEEALKRSVLKPLRSGAVYPESFYEGLAKWRQENNGKGGAICDTSVTKCLPSGDGTSN